MSDDFYLLENPEYTIFDSLRDSVNFTINRNLTTYKGRYCAHSSFVDIEGNPQHWHNFGDIEGVGWAANALGAAWELYHYATFLKNEKIRDIALSIIDHALYNGFVDFGKHFVTPYRDISADKFYLNYEHQDKYNNWLCAGSQAKIAYQYLLCSDLVSDWRKKRDLELVALDVAEWVESIELAPNGWYPRRSTVEGKAYPKTAEGDKDDPIFACSGDGLYVLQLFTEMNRREMKDYRDTIKEKTELFIQAGGFFGSINHDTYDENECVAYAEAFLILKDVADFLDDYKILEFAYERCLAGLERYEMKEDRNGVATKGLLYMEDSWDTAYLWENAQASWAYLVAYKHTSNREYLKKALTILRAIAKHHHGDYGFLTEGVDWNNHVSAVHHFDEAEYGDIKYTEPFLNNMHIVTPTLYYLNNFAIREEAYYDLESEVFLVKVGKN